MLSSGDVVNGLRSISCKGTASLIHNPLYGCALLLNLNPNEGMIVLAWKSNIEIGSPKYRILSGDVLVSDVILLAKSLDTFLHISAPKPLNKPPSLKPVAESTDAPVASPPATPAPTISSLTMFFLIMGLICYLVQLDCRRFQTEQYHMGYYLLFYIVFLMIMPLHRLRNDRSQYRFHGGICSKHLLFFLL